MAYIHSLPHPKGRWKVGYQYKIVYHSSQVSCPYHWNRRSYNPHQLVLSPTQTIMKCITILYFWPLPPIGQGRQRRWNKEWRRQRKGSNSRPCAWHHSTAWSLLLPSRSFSILSGIRALIDFWFILYQIVHKVKTCNRCSMWPRIADFLSRIHTNSKNSLHNKYVHLNWWCRAHIEQFDTRKTSPKIGKGYKSCTRVSITIVHGGSDWQSLRATL